MPPKSSGASIPPPARRYTFVASRANPIDSRTLGSVIGTLSSATAAVAASTVRAKAPAALPRNVLIYPPLNPPGPRPREAETRLRLFPRRLGYRSIRRRDDCQGSYV